MGPQEVIKGAAVGGLICVLSACGGERFESAAKNVFHGQVETGYPAAAFLQLSGGAICSGMLVGRHTVLTAAHCVREGPASDIRVTFDGVSEVFHARDSTPHPDYVEPNVLPIDDVGLVELTSDPPLEPVAIASIAPVVGDSLTVIGYGVNGNVSPVGTKRSASVTVIDLISTSLIQISGYSSSSPGSGFPCAGDSGGPALATRDGRVQQVGVFKGYAGTPCGSGGIYMRAEVYKGWLLDTSAGDLAIDDTTAPVVEIVAPKADDRVAASFSVEFTATDEGLIKSLGLSLDGTAQEQLTANEVSSNRYRYELANVTPGPHEIVVTAEGYGGTTGSDQVSVMIAEPLAYGQACVGSSDCASSLCVPDPATSELFCTQDCDDSTPCPNGALCLGTSDPNRSVCGTPGSTTTDPPQPSGCQHASAQELPLLLLALFAAWRRRWISAS